MLVPILALFHEQGAVDLNFTFTTSHIVMLIVMVMTFAIIGTQLSRNSAYRLAETNSQLAPLIYTNLVFTAVWQFTLFDERFSLHQYIGLGLIVGANMLRSGLLKQMAKQMLKRFR